MKVLILILLLAGCANMPIKYSTRICANGNLAQVEGTSKFLYVSYCVDGPFYPLETEEYHG